MSAPPPTGLVDWRLPVRGEAAVDLAFRYRADGLQFDLGARRGPAATAAGCRRAAPPHRRRCRVAPLVAANVLNDIGLTADAGTWRPPGYAASCDGCWTSGGTRRPWCSCPVPGRCHRQREALLRTAEVLRPVAARAHARGLLLANENVLPALHAVRLAEEVGSPAFRLLLDTYNPVAAGLDVPGLVAVTHPWLAGQIHLKDGLTGTTATPPAGRRRRRRRGDRGRRGPPSEAHRRRPGERPPRRGRSTAPRGPRPGPGLRRPGGTHPDGDGAAMPLVLTAQTLLFDMDGTLVDSTEAVARTWSRFARRHGLDAGRILASAHGQRTAETVAAHAPPGTDVEAETAWLVGQDLADTGGTVAVPGAAELLAALPPHRWALVTSAGQELAVRRMAAAGLPLPDVLISADDVREASRRPRASSPPPNGSAATPPAPSSSRTPNSACWPPARRLLPGGRGPARRSRRPGPSPYHRLHRRRLRLLVRGRPAAGASGLRAGAHRRTRLALTLPSPHLPNGVPPPCPSTRQHAFTATWPPASKGSARSSPVTSPNATNRARRWP
ncbi:TIM barrel protein [Streptomyces sp. S6]|nr:TIM barrel protein [Streptomyces sp. S6]